MGVEMEWYHNISMWTALAAWLVAQTMKMLVTFVETKRVDFSALVSTGGMPSAHSAMACGLATTVGLEAGFGTPLFATTLAFAVVVMFDAQSVRRAAGLQARLLNQIVDEIFRNHKFSEEKLAELLGHTRLEVFMGLLTGVIVALGIYAFFGF
jgi:uncharacterized protein